MHRASLFGIIAALFGGCSTCDTCDPPGIGLELAAVDGNGTAIPFAPGSYAVGVVAGRATADCTFTVPDGATCSALDDADCLVGTTCAISYTRPFAIGESLGVGSLGMDLPSVDDDADELAVTVSLDGTAVLTQAIPITWRRVRSDPRFQIEPSFCKCSHTEEDPFLAVPLP